MTATEIPPTVVGSFANRTEAQDAVRGLRAAGFADDRIGVVGKRLEYHGEQTSTSGLPNDPTHSRWEEGTGVGAAAGAVTGTGLGLAVAAGLIPGVGPLIAGGALMALLASAGAGATVGTVVGGLIGLGVPEDEAGYYQDELTSGRVLVSVDAGDRRPEAVDILRRYGAVFSRPAVV
jgi:hypothetical protein